ncbi:MAG: S8 family serine peptidase [Anaerolineales bacterium]|nr:S8 family serine peptidase [Anaerolineales bacterium]
MSLLLGRCRIITARLIVQNQENYFTISGTSQATAVITGVVALMLQVDPTLSPDDVKCRLMAAVHPAVGANSTNS